MKHPPSPRFCLTAGCFLFLFLPVMTPTERAPYTVSGERAKEYIRFLASDKLEGRRSGTPGYRKAAEFAAARFKEWGLQPAGEKGTYFQEVPLPDFEWTTGVPGLSVEERAFLLDDGDFSLVRGSTAGTEVEGEVLFLGYGISAPDRGLDEYADLDVEGKVVLVFTGSPAGVPDRTDRLFPSREDGEKGEEKEGNDPWVEESRDTVKIRTAFDKGAAAILLYDPEAPAPSERSGYRYYYARRRSLGFEPERPFLAFRIEERVFRAIMKQDPQESPRGLSRRVDEMRRAIRDKQVRSRATGVRVRLKGYDTLQKFSREKGEARARNVLARIEGTDPALKDQYVMVGAHLDHVGMRNGYVYNGADDNASGSSLVLEVARALAEGGFAPRRTVVFACWCGEELGLLGSYHFVRHPCGGVDLDRVTAYFNMDMVGRGTTMNASGALNFPEIWEVIKKDQDPEILKIVKPSTGGPGGSDHSGFIVKGIEALMLITSGGKGHPDYHQPEDDAEKMDPAILRQVGQFVLQAVVNLAQETETHLLVEDRQARYRALRMEIANYNPALPHSRWKVVSLEAHNPAELKKLLVARAVKVLEGGGERDTAAPSGGAHSRPGPSRTPERPARTVERGIGDLAVFGGDAELLVKAASLFGFGRVDIRGDDGAWIVKGRLTDAGREALNKMEAAEVVVHLVSPAKELLEDFLGAASKPFLVTGTYELDESMADRAVQKGVFFGIDLDPSRIDEFIERLETWKDRLGKRELLVAWLTSEEGLEKAKWPLYRGLRDRGWAPREICGTRRTRGGVMGGNLRSLGRRARERRRRR